MMMETKKTVPSSGPWTSLKEFARYYREVHSGKPLSQILDLTYTSPIHKLISRYNRYYLELGNHNEDDLYEIFTRIKNRITSLLLSKKNTVYFMDNQVQKKLQLILQHEPYRNSMMDVWQEVYDISYVNEPDYDLYWFLHKNADPVKSQFMIRLMNLWWRNNRDVDKYLQYCYKYRSPLMPVEELREYYMYWKGYNFPPQLPSLARHVRSCIRQDSTGITLPDGRHMNYDECVSDMVKNLGAIEQSNETVAPNNWLVGRMTTMLTDHIIHVMTSSWPGIVIAASVVTSMVSTIMSIITTLMHIIRNGNSGLLTTSLICSFIALLSQAATIFGAVNLFTQFPNLADIITSIFSGFDESQTIGEMLVAPTSTPTLLQSLSTGPSISPAHPPNDVLQMPWAYVATEQILRSYKDASEFLPSGHMPSPVAGDGWCGYASILSGFDIIPSRENCAYYRKTLATHLQGKGFDDMLTVEPDRNGFLPSAGWVSDELLLTLAGVHMCNIVLFQPEVQMYEEVTVKNAVRTIYIKFENNHYTPYVRTTKQAHMPSLESMLTMGTGILALSVSIAGACGSTKAASFSKNFIHSTALRKSMLQEVKDTRVLVENIAEDVFGYTLNNFSKLKREILDISEKISSYLENAPSYYMAHPKEYFNFRELLMTAKSIFTSCGSISSQMPHNLQSAYSLLAADIQRAQSVFIQLGRAMAAGRSKQEPVPLMFVGRPGVGKTYFVRNYLIPEIQKRFGWTSEKYSLNFGGQIYFPPYTGQEICLYDEFLAMGAQDPLIPHLNGICSIDHYNMPGADLEFKTQFCMFKALMLISNRAYVNIREVLTPEAEKAFYSRLTRIEIVNTSLPMGDDYSREKVAHSDDYSEFEIRRYLNSGSSTCTELAESATAPGVDTTQCRDPYVIITKEELREYIVQRIVEKSNEFSALQKGPKVGDEVPQTIPVAPTYKVAGENPVIPPASIEKHNILVEKLANTIVDDMMIKVEHNTVMFPPQLAFISQLQSYISGNMSEYKTGLLTYFGAYVSALEKEIHNDTKVKEAAQTIIHVIIPQYCKVLMKEDLYARAVKAVPLEVIHQGTTDAYSEHLVILMYGSTNVGKSTAAHNLGMELAHLFKMPLVNVTTQKLIKISVDRPSIVVLHDKMDDENAYIQFYDSLPKPSIIINTNNLRFTKSYCSARTQETEQESSSLCKRLVNSAVNYVTSIRKCTTILPHSASTSEPGFARRIGYKGYLYHAGEQHYRGAEISETFEVQAYGRLIDPVENEEVLLVDLIKRIVVKYRKIIEHTGQIIFTPGKVIESDADVVLRFTSKDQARTYVNDVVKILGLYKKFATGSNTGGSPELSISDRVVNSTFRFQPHMFRINNNDSLEAIMEMAQRSYGLLMKGSYDFTCLLDLNDFKAYCKGGVIRYDAGPQYTFSALTHEVVKINTSTTTTQAQVNIYNVNDSTRELVATYSGDQIVNVLLSGAQSEDIQVEHAQYIVQNEKEFLDHPYLLPSVIKMRPRQVMLKHVVEQSSVFYDIWDSFVNSKWFILVKILTGLMIALFGICALLGIAKMIYSFCTSEKTKGETPGSERYVIYANGKRYELELVREGKVLRVLVLSSRNNSSFADDIEDDYMPLTDWIEYVMGEHYRDCNQFRIEFFQSDIKNQRNLQKMGKSKPKAPIRRLPTVAASQAISAAQLAIMTKVKKARVWVEGARSQCYGLRWKMHYVLCPAHIWNNVGDVGSIMVPTADGSLMSCSAQVVYVDHPNDIAVAMLESKRLPAATDLTKYFIKDSQLDIMRECALVTCAVNPKERAFKFHQADHMVQTGAISISYLNANEVGDGAKRMLRFVRSGLQCILTYQGDCGSPYLCIDSSADHNMIVGLHSSIMPSQNQTFGSAITQEYLKSIVIKQSFGKPATAIAGFEQAPVNAVELQPGVHMPASTETDVVHVMDEYYTQWYDSLTDAFIGDDDDIWYDAQDEVKVNYNVALLGYDCHHKPAEMGKPSHLPTPWAAELGTRLPNPKQLAVTKVKQHTAPETLTKLGGRPHILATQVAKYNDYCPLSSTFDKLLRQAKDLLRVDASVKYGGKLRLLTDEEVINGLYMRYDDELYGCLEPMDLDTAAGHYAHHKWKMVNKRKIFEKTDYKTVSGRDIYAFSLSTPAQDMRKRITDYETQAVAGRRVLCPMVDQVKHEIVDKPNKSRLFTVLPLEETFVGRKYSGALQAMVMKQHGVAHTQIGINPLPGFHSLYQRMMKVSQYGEAGDYSRWDKHMPAQIMRAAFEVCSELYMDDTDDPKLKKAIENVYRVLADSFINSLSILDGYVYFKSRGVPSGCPMTAMINSFCNDIIMYMYLLDAVENHREFMKSKPTDAELIAKYGMTDYNNICSDYLRYMRKPINVTMDWINKHFDWATYGDDIVTAISEKYLWLINFCTRKAFLKRTLGMDYDSPYKDGTEIPYDKLENLMFISRIFRQEAGITFAALKKSSIEALLFWARTNNPTQWVSNIRDVCAEAVLWGEEYYNEIVSHVKFILKYCASKGQPIMYTPTPYKLALTRTIDLIIGSDAALLPEQPQKDMSLKAKNNEVTRVYESDYETAFLKEVKELGLLTAISCDPSKLINKIK